jgi:hypothetical protein
MLRVAGMGPTQITGDQRESLPEFFAVGYYYNRMFNLRRPGIAAPACVRLILRAAGKETEVENFAKVLTDGIVISSANESLIHYASHTFAKLARAVAA